MILRSVCLIFLLNNWIIILIWLSQITTETEISKLLQTTDCFLQSGSSSCEICQLKSWSNQGGSFHSSLLKPRRHEWNKLFHASLLLFHASLLKQGNLGKMIQGLRLVFYVFMIFTSLVRSFKTFNLNKISTRLNMERIVLNNPVSDFDKELDKGWG